MRTDASGEPRLQHDEERVLERGEVFLDGLDARAAALQVARGALGGRQRVRIDGAIADPGQPCDPQTGHAHVARVVFRLRARVRIAVGEPRDRVEARRGLGDRARDRADVGRRGEQVGLVHVGDAAERGLESDDAAAGGRDPDRAAAVGAEGQGRLTRATAAAAPPDEPPAVRERSHGFRVAPNSGLSVSGLWPNSGVVVLPIRIAPASRRRRTGTASSAGIWSAKMNEPIVVRTPAVNTSSFTENGTPWSGPSGPPS